MTSSVIKRDDYLTEAQVLAEWPMLTPKELRKARRKQLIEFCICLTGPIYTPQQLQNYIDNTYLRGSGELPKPKPKAAEYQAPRPIDTREYTFIYIFECGGFLKIGQSRAWRRRLADIQTAIPFEVMPLLVVCDRPYLENKLHQRFFKFKHRGEWFRDCPEIREYIDRSKPLCVMAQRSWNDLSFEGSPQ